MNTKFYKEFQDKYPTILGSDRNISYVDYLEELVTELQQQVKNQTIPVVIGQSEHIFCPDCGIKKEHKVYTDVNTKLICNNPLCRAITP